MGKWGEGCCDGIGEQSDPEASSLSGGAVTELYAGQSSGIWGKERSLVKIRLSSILLQFIRGDEQFN